MAERIIEFSVPEGVEPERADKIFASKFDDVSRTRLQKAFEADRVTFDGVIIDKRFKVNRPGLLRAVLEESSTANGPEPVNIPFDIIYEDTSIIVVNKAAGMVTHPGNGTNGDTLVNALLYHLGATNAGGGVRPGIVHRIDKDTSGLLVVAKTEEAHEKLSAQFKDHSIHRKYLAVTKGVPSRADPRLQGLKGVGFEDGGLIRIATHIERHKTDRKRMTITHNSGRHAITRIQLLEDFGDAALVACMLETGRTHQIRVHLSHIGHEFFCRTEDLDHSLIVGNLWLHR